MKTDDSKLILIRRDRRDFTGRLLVSGLSVLAGGTLLGQLSCKAPQLGERKMTLNPLKQSLRDILEERIKTDDPTNYKETGWDKVRFGIYYDEDPELVNIVVYETTASVAQSQRIGKYLPDKVWRNLIRKVTPNNTPDEALDPMLEAVMLAEPLPLGNEGPVITRPTHKPTLRVRKNANNG